MLILIAIGFIVTEEETIPEQIERIMEEQEEEIEQFRKRNENPG